MKNIREIVQNPGYFSVLVKHKLAQIFGWYVLSMKRNYVLDNYYFIQQRVKL